MSFLFDGAQGQTLLLILKQHSGNDAWRMQKA